MTQGFAFPIVLWAVFLQVVAVLPSSTPPTTNVPHCPGRPAPVNGYASATTPKPVGGVVAYQCNSGYELEDGSDRDRRKRGNSNDNDRRDDDEDNDDDEDDYNGFGDNDGKGWCFGLDNRKRGNGRDDGYETCSLCLAPRRQGSPAGVWSTPVPTCDVIKNYCPNPSDPNRGGVSVSGSRTIGSVATYRCDTGYRLVGSTTTTCVAGGRDAGTGVWSPAAPTCQPMSGSGCTRDGRHWRCSCASRDVRCFDSRSMNGCNRRGSGSSTTYDCDCASGYAPVCIGQNGQASIEGDGTQAAEVGGDGMTALNVAEPSGTPLWLIGGIVTTLAIAVFAAAAVAYRKRRAFVKVGPAVPNVQQVVFTSWQPDDDGAAERKTDWSPA